MPMRVFLVMILMTGATAPAALAQPKGAQPDSTVQAITACRQIANPEQRLACYDASAANLAKAVGQGEITVVTREQANQTRRSLFGFAIPEFPFFKRKAGEQELREISTTLVSARPYGPGRHRLQVAEAQGVWETTESLSREPEAGQPIKITRGALGSYWLKIGNQREVRGRRVR